VPDRRHKGTLKRNHRPRDGRLRGRRWPQVHVGSIRLVSISGRGPGGGRGRRAVHPLGPASGSGWRTPD